MNIAPRLLRLVRSSRLALGLTICLGFLGGIFIVVQARFLSQVVSRVFLQGQGLNDIAALLKLLLLVIVVRACLAWGLDVAANTAAVRIKSDLRGQLIRHILELGPAFVRGESRDASGDGTVIRTGELVNTAVEGVESLDAYFSQYLPQLVLAALIPLTFLFMIFPVDQLSAVVLLVTAPLIPLFMILIGNLAEALTKRQWRTLSRLSAYFLDVLQGLTTLKILGRSRAQIQVIAQISERYRQTTMGVLRVTFLSALVLEMVSTLSTAIVAVEIGLRLLYGGLSFEQAFFVLLLAPEFYLPLRMLGTRFHAGMAGVAAAQRLFEILDLKPRGQSDGNIEIRASSFDIRFENVHYAYQDSRPALNGVSFEISHGKSLALVGPTGAGKSTLIALLLKFIQPQQGEIQIDGVPLADISAESWRRNVAWVPQNPYLFHDTVAENIRLGRPEASPEEVIWAAQQAHVHGFIQSLPQGYETLVGERGARLSGGQAQRIALARAFLKNAPLLILDESTSNLDPENEAYIRDATQRLKAGRTTILIAHRLSSIYQADKILVLDNGRVVEAGSHSTLLGNDGLYSRLVKASSESNSPLGTGTNDDLLAAQGRFFEAGSDPLPGFDLQPGSRTPLWEARPRSSTTDPLQQLLKLIAPFSSWVALAVLMGFATIGSAVGLMTTSAYIISAAALHPSIAALNVAIVGVRFFGISRGLFRYLERYVSHQVTFRLLARMRVWFYQALEPLAPARLASYRAGDLLSRAIKDIVSLENFYVRALSPPLVALLVSALVAGYLYSFHPYLGGTLLFFLLLAGLGVPLLVSGLSRGTGLANLQANASLNVSLVDSIQGMEDLLAFGRQGAWLAKVSAAGGQLGMTQKRMARIGGLQSALMVLLANLSMWVILLLAVPLVQAGIIQGVFLALILLGALTCFEAVLPLPLAFQYLERDLEAMRRLLALVDTVPEVVSPANPLPPPHSINLSVKGLSFRYGPDDPLALDNISFDLPEGKRMAIVGPSGAGKSTLVNLLLRFWQVRQGEIMLNGQDLGCYEPEDVRDCIGVVSQTTHLFNASLRDNLLLANQSASDSQVIQAAKFAQLHDFIQRLPQGYDTWIGEQGVRLSGGERQRLAVARALLRDAPLLILDEATANLDAITERELLQAILQLNRNRTTLMITHRLVAMEWMDEILVLDAGRVKERGTHGELLQRGGLYRHMWDLQNQVLADGLEIPKVAG